MKAAVLLVLLFLTLGCVTQNFSNPPGTGTKNPEPLPPIPSPAPNQPIQVPPVTPPAAENLDDKPLGSLNHAYLQAAPFPKIIIEIDYIQDHEPSSSTKNDIKEFFETVTKKPVTFSGGNIIVPTKDTYTVSDVWALERANRRHYTSGDAAVVYFTFLNGEFENGGALGVAYKASSVALFVEKINDATTALILYSQIEEAVTMHELGHLLGLVNINYKSEKDHEDASHPGHSNNENSVMFWAVEDISLKNILHIGPPSEFDEDDMFDIQQIKEGRY